MTSSRPLIRHGAFPEPDGTRFRLWAPARRTARVVFEPGSSSAGAGAPAAEPPPDPAQLDQVDEGLWEGFVAGARAGHRYRIGVDRDGPWPDPASRFQPDGVHGASQIVDPSSYQWNDAAWPGVEPHRLVVYELHVGTFSPEGSFAGVERRLPHLADLGVTAIELMPVADFPGRWNWGYDGVSLFAPARAYGAPDDLRRLVDRAHQAGLAVLLDVVYNHLGPDGAYLAAFAPTIFSEAHETPWGRAINLDRAGSNRVRDFFVDHAVTWLEEYHLDGLRLDATHAIIDESPTHFLAELSDRVRAHVRRPVLLIAEDHRNLSRLVRPRTDGGYGLDGVWSDDFHHQLRRALTGDADGYFADFTGTTADLAATIRRGWFYTGQFAPYFDEPRGTDPGGLAPARFTIFAQNHDQIGNRALGDRLHHTVPRATSRAVAVLLLLAPEVPLLFMGQEWSASSPFLYFTDHEPELGRLVTEGRRREFRRFQAFASPEGRARIPDPQRAETFERSRLPWEELARPPHDETLRLHRTLLALRRSHAAFSRSDWEGFDAGPAGPDALWYERRLDGGAVLVIVRLRGSGPVALEGAAPARLARSYAARVLLSTEDSAFTDEPAPIVQLPGEPAVWHFERPGGLVLEWAHSVA